MITIKCDSGLCLEHLKLIVILKPKSTTAGFETGTEESD